jgi:hypothetical protein
LKEPGFDAGFFVAGFVIPSSMREIQPAENGRRASERP